MQFKPSNRDDIFRYFRNTFVKFKEFGEQLFHIDGVDHMRVYGTHESGEAFTLYLDDETPYEMEYILPHKSFFQAGANAAQLVRVPAKQYFRGLSGNNTQILYLNSSGMVKQLDLTFENLKMFVQKQQFYSVSGALNAEMCTSCALSPRMMLFRPTKKLYIDFVHVATVYPGTNTIKMVRSIFKNEVEHMLSKYGEPWKVGVPEAKGTKHLVKPDELVKAMYNAAPTTYLEEEF